MGIEVASVYCDGGVIGRNPSRRGGTWAWRHIDRKGFLLRMGSGVVRPEDAGMPTITNNLTELLAALEGMALLPDGWAGAIWTDSNVTLLRLRGGKKFNGIPTVMVERTKSELARLGLFQAKLLGGHPTENELFLGRKLKSGLPVDWQNVYCDRECTRLAKMG
jgi:hypothetical protein